jgi:hypothetical protein
LKAIVALLVQWPVSSLARFAAVVPASEKCVIDDPQFGEELLKKLASV